MILMTTFFMNVLCALVPCQPSFRSPEISDPIQDVSGRENVRQLRNAQIDSSSVDSENFIDDLNAEPRVTTTTGEVEGYFMRTVKGRIIQAFEGIPYSQPPVNNNRFRPPVPKVAWKHLLKAKAVGPECLQYNPFRGFRVTGQENCLFLNIYTPKTRLKANEKKFGVIIFIHGGFYNFGNGGEHGPAYMLEKDVIVTTINYRLGILGFASTGDTVLPGNNGLKDQAMAIKWIYENIEKFGGDPNRITLMGFSAGAASVHFHMTRSKTSPKYFQKAISLSGTAFNPWALLPVQDVRNATERMAELFRCEVSRSKDILQCLTRQNPAALVARQSALFPRWPYPYVLFGPVIEPESSDAIIVESPEDAYASGHVSKIPWISSITKQEGHFSLLFPYLMRRMGALRQRWHDIAPQFLVYANETQDVEEVTNKITKFYFDKDAPLDATMEPFSQAYTDRHFGNALHRSLQLHSSIAPTYAYVFDYLGQFNMGNLIGLRKHEWGVGHGEDIFYFLNSSSSYTGFKKTDTEFHLSAVMVNLIANFVSGSEPLYTTENATNVKIWDRIDDPDKMFYLKFDTKVEMVPQPHHRRILFWNSLNLTSPFPNKSNQNS